jgi:hypothetical protein
MKFLINGFWKDDKTKFSDYLVTDYDDNSDNDDDDNEIFYFGLNEEEIKEAIKLRWDTTLEFVITSYSKL